MQTQTHPTCLRTRWQGRKAVALENGVIRLVSLLSGGHIAELRFLRSTGHSTLNPLWTPPWKTIDHDRYNELRHRAVYGPAVTGKLICGIAGHNLCLDYFGAPSDEEARLGLSIHGEAPVARWGLERLSASGRSASFLMSVRLPVAGLRFRREATLRRGESVAYFVESVTNETNADRLFHWTEHVTFGPPFLHRKDSRMAISAARGRTFAHGYEGRALLASSRNFRWPIAPGEDGKPVDLSRPFSHPGLGVLATVLMEPRRDMEYVAAINHRHGLLAGYCFSRDDFPWTAIWEENKTRSAAPWRHRCEARGLEFGSTPFPVGRREAFANGPLFGAPYFSVVPARSTKTVRYLAFLASVPSGFGEIADVRLPAARQGAAGGQIVIRGTGGDLPLAASSFKSGARPRRGLESAD